MACDGAVFVTVKLKVAISVSNKSSEDAAAEHVDCAGAPEQLIDTGPRKPFNEESCTL